MLLVTGATGYIGQKLLQQFSHNQKVAVLTRRITPKLQQLFPHVSFIEGNLQEPQSLAGKFSEVKAVIHMAAITHAVDQKKYFEVNVQGTENLINALPETIQQFIYVSTTCAEPHSGGYGESKLAAEELIKSRYSNHVILRVADVFGGEGEKSLEQLIQRTKKSLLFPIIGSGKYLMAPVHVDDVITSIRLSLKLKGQYILVISGKETLTFLELVSLLYKKQQKRPFFIHVPVWFLDKVIRVLAHVHQFHVYPDQVQRFVVKKDLDSQKTWQLLNHTPQSFLNWIAEVT